VNRSPQAAGPASRGVLIRAMRPADAGQVLAIYQAGLDTGQASFETTAPAWEHFDAARLPAHRHVAADAGTGQILGWTAAVAVSDRCVYAGGSSTASTPTPPTAAGASARSCSRP
jgi:L-amino acid N-acyltransferase YncA